MFKLWNSALSLALARHGDQKRKGSDAPYIVHPIGVSENAFLFYPANRALAIAALLHDLIEDTNTTGDEIEQGFGLEVRTLVEGVTSEQGANWHETRLNTINKLRTVDNLDIVRLKACDALHNATAIARDVRFEGKRAWSRFKVANERDVTDYYRTMHGAFAYRLGENEPVVQELAHAIDHFKPAD